MRTVLSDSLMKPRFALALALVCAAACGEDRPARATAARAPVEIVDLGGLEAALAAHRGQAVLVNWWATWCEPCVAELPDLAAVVEPYSGRGAVLLGVSYDLMVPGVERTQVVARVERFLAGRGLSFPVLIYDAADADAINERFDLPGPIPVTLAFDRAGVLVDREDGPADRARFEAMLRTALAAH